MKYIVSLMIILLLITSMITYGIEIEIDAKKNISNENIEIELLKEKRNLLFKNDMEKIVESVLSRYSKTGVVGVYSEELNTGYEYGYNDKKTYYDSYTNSENAYFNAASVVKLMLSFSIYKLVEDGILDLDKVYIEPFNNKSILLRKDLPHMIEVSSSDIHNYIIRILQTKGLHNTIYYYEDGKATKEFKSIINDKLAEYGFEHLKVNAEIGPAVGWSINNNFRRYGNSQGGRINPYEVGKLLEYIYINKDKDVYMDMLNDALLGNIYTSRIPRGISYRAPVAHKTGTVIQTGIFNDAGIVYLDGNPFILTFMTSEVEEKEAYRIVRRISKEVYNYMEKRK